MIKRFVPDPVPIRSALAVLVAGLLLAFGPAGIGRAAPTFPPLTGRVVDAANILPPQQATEIDGMLADLEAKNGDQLVVATVPSLGGETIEEYGVDLGRAWGIGQKDKNNGAILLVAPNERKVRIEVGYGLEGDLTDAMTSVIINSSILPRFKAGDMAGGIRRGTEDIVSVLGGNGEAIKEQARRAAPVQAKDSVGSGIVTLIFWLFIFFFVIRPMFFGGRRRRRGGFLPWIIPMGGGWGGGRGGGWSGGGGGGGFSGGGGSFGGGGSSGSW
ncbi:uncharacterized protein SAMN05216548_105216 [Faunimonas pinastri]|uniref:TPM domain-containing protein n=1 Tax=Faunimonas pinastri TaxID=1855383 RepID=A0A1H9H1E1_9HYPH|nr:TPM domain-containing protein [Faunimonas pinastri]SEQ56174.1 uncharacterized protein SAMN05216548_105216 [Faunimonas pinastri]